MTKFNVVKAAETATTKAANAVVMLFRPSDGRPYISLRRATRSGGTKIGEVLVGVRWGGLNSVKKGGFKTDVWVGPDGIVHCGGWQCPRCKKRFDEPTKCCGGDVHRIKIPLPKGDEGLKLLELAEKGGPSPVWVAGVVAEGNGLIGRARSQGELPMALIPEGGSDAADFLAAHGKDVLDATESIGEELVLVPLSWDACGTDLDELAQSGVDVCL